MPESTIAESSDNLMDEPSVFTGGQPLPDAWLEMPAT